jgi:hypothetical protein
MNRNVHYHFHNSTTLDDVFSHMNSVHTVPPYFFVPFYYYHPPVYRYTKFSVLFMSSGRNLLVWSLAAYMRATCATDLILRWRVPFGPKRLCTT